MSDRTRAAERALSMNDEGAKKVIAASRNLVIAFYSTIKVRRFHHKDNEAVARALTKLQAAFKALFDIQYDVQLMYYAQDFYINETRIKVSREVYEFFANFASELEKRKIGGMQFRKVPSIGDLNAFIEAYEEVGQLEEDVDRYANLQALLKAAGVQGFHMTRLVTGDLVEMPVVDARTFVKQTYFRAIEVLDSVYTEAKQGRPVTLKGVKRVVQNFVDVLSDRREDTTDLLLLLTDIKNWRNYLANHGVNVCVHALFMGKALGLDKLALRNLGTAAMLADIGNASLPAEVLEHEGPLNDKQKAVIATHPIRGVPILTRFQEMDTGTIKAVVASLHHHKGLNGDGYPKRVKSEATLFAQIIQVADRYDAMTSARPHRPEPMTPPMAIEELSNAADRGEMDPVLVKLFVHWMGSVPAGTVVVLPNGDIGVVVQAQSRLGKRTENTLVCILGDKADTKKIEMQTDRLITDERHVQRAVEGKEEKVSELRMELALAA